MRPVQQLSVIVPAYNEEHRLEPTLRSMVDYFRAHERSVEVIVVDDGSEDGTSDLVNRLASDIDEIRLIRLAENQGKGYAVRTGVVNALGELVLYADADGATPIEEIERLETALERGATLAIGSRALHAAGVQVIARWYRRLMGRVFHALVCLLTVRGLADTQCGFKLLRGAAARDLFSRIRMNGFSFDVELLLVARHVGYSIAEIPVNWEHQAGSRMNLVFDSLRMTRDLFLIRGHAMRGHYDRPHIAPLTVPEYSCSALAVGARVDLNDE